MIKVTRQPSDLLDAELVRCRLVPDYRDMHGHAYPGQMELIFHKGTGEMKGKAEANITCSQNLRLNMQDIKELAALFKDMSE